MVLLNLAPYPPFYSLRLTIYIIQGDQLKMAVFILYHGKSYLSSVHVYTVYLHTLHWTSKSHYTRYQKNRAMFNWSPW